MFAKLHVNKLGARFGAIAQAVKMPSFSPDYSLAVA